LTEELPEEMDEKTREKVYQTIFSCIEQLPEKQQYIFFQQVVEGRTFRELADETGESINTLIARKQYAIKFLKTKLKKLLTHN
jgi:DNA-directed RNA polymerase specialized sigma24 family protein